jgi:hypothetical protein
MPISMRTRKFALALVVVFCGSLLGTKALLAMPFVSRHTLERQKHKDHTFLTSSAHNATEETESLSGLVTGMLQSHQEMSQELAVEEAHQDEGMPPLGNDGIYRILNENQYQ